MSINNIEIVAIPVADQERALAFYRDKLGLTLVIDSTFEENMRWVQFAVSNDPHAAAISLVNWFDAMKPGAVQGLILATDDIETTYQTLKDAGVEIQPIYETPWGRFANFTDPDGNGWALHQG